MGDSEKAYEDLNRFLVRNNLSIAGFLKYQKQRLDKLLAMPDAVKEKYDELYEQLNKDLENYKDNKRHVLTAQERGSLFEKMIGCLFFSGNTLLFNEAINCRTSTNEIDLLIRWSDVAIQNQINAIYDYMGRSFLCECKNYEGGVGVTHVGKFYSLIKVNLSNFGILFATAKVKGRNKWDAAQGLIRKIALRDDIYIIAIEWEDLTKIYNCETNLLRLIGDKYDALKNDIDYEKYIKKHEMADEFLRRRECEYGTKKSMRQQRKT